MKTYNLKIFIISIVCLGMVPINAQEKTNPTSQSEELGKVSWYRDYTEATALSRKTDKPVLILFQEVPGCMTCRNYGQNVLTHPLMVEAIENEFIPLAIYNNKTGKDRQILQLYNEPTWNNPVVRIVNADGKNLTERIAGQYSAKALYQTMIKVLKNRGKAIPEYMKLLGEEISSVGNSKDAYYKMYCFWTGEKQLGYNHGVVNTEAGFMSGSEVVKVTYNQKVISELELSKFAKEHSMTPISKDNSYRPATKDEDYYLQHSAYKHLPLTKLQRTKINTALGTGKSAKKYLSPKQLLWLKSGQPTNSAIRFNKPFIESWESLSLR